MSIAFIIILAAILYGSLKKYESSLDNTDKAVLIALFGAVILIILLRRIIRYFRMRSVERRRQRQLKQEEYEKEQQAEHEERQKRIEEKIQQYMLPSVEGAVKKYVYEKIDVIVRSGYRPQDYFGQPVTLQTREGDRGATLRVKVGGEWIATVDRGTIVSVAAEWLKTGEPYRACVLHADDELHTMSIAAIFYRDELGKLQARYPDTPRYKIMGTRSEDVYLIALGTQIGEELTIDLDPEKNRYALYNYPGEIVGYLSASAARYAEEHNIDSVKAYCCDKQLANGVCELYVQLFD